MKLEFTLCQHTPLIQFDRDQLKYGATLRATEIKPKLDRYLINIRGGWKLIPEKWKVGKEKAIHEALDYRIHFSATIAFTDEKNIIDQKTKKTLAYFSTIDGTVTCFHDDLAALIKDNLPEFFATHNFGNRTSKGYGCFTVATINRIPAFTGNTQSYFEQLLKKQFGSFYSKELDLISRYFQRVLLGNLRNKSNEYQAFANGKLKEFLISKEFLMLQNQSEGEFKDGIRSLQEEITTLASKNKVSPEEIDRVVNKEIIYLWANRRKALSNQILDQITEDHRDLKSGRNFHGYYKSLLMEYFCEKGIRWEKRRMKQEMQKKTPQVFNALLKRGAHMRIDDCPSKTSGDGQYLRGLLGLADYFEFKADQDSDSVKINVAQVKLGDHDTDVVQRFQTPTLFKVFGNTIYLIPLRIPRELTKRLDGNPRLFSFDLRATVSGNHIEEHLFSDAIPEAFNVADFLDYNLRNSTRKIRGDNRPIHQLLGYTKH